MASCRRCQGVASGRRLDGTGDVPVGFLGTSNGKFFVSGSNCTLKVQSRLTSMVGISTFGGRVGSVVRCHAVRCCQEQCMRAWSWMLFARRMARQVTE